MSEFINVVLLGLLAVTALRVIFLQDLFAVIMLFSLYSFLSALIFVNLDAVDVAFTEASCRDFDGTDVRNVSPHRTEHRKKADIPLSILLFMLVTGAALSMGHLTCRHLVIPTIQLKLVARHIDVSPEEVGLPNMVTSVLASYRGFDTLGETAVFFAAAIGVISLSIPKKERVNKIDGAIPRSTACYYKTHCTTDYSFCPLCPISWRLRTLWEFSGGVIAAAAFILYSLVFGLEFSMQVVKSKLLLLLAPFGVLLYAGTGVLSMLFGGNFLDSQQSNRRAALWHYYYRIGCWHHGICSDASIFYSFAGQATRKDPQ